MLTFNFGGSRNIQYLHCVSKNAPTLKRYSSEL